MSHSNEHSILFTSRVSQVVNLFGLIFTLIITVNVIVFEPSITWFLATKFDLLKIDTAKVQYISIGFIAFIWVRQIWQYFVVKNIKYEFESDRLIISTGVVNKTSDFIEYYRFKDYTITRSLIERFFNLNSMRIISSDRSDPIICLNYITNFSNNERKVRDQIEKSAVNGRGREIDIV